MVSATLLVYHAPGSSRMSLLYELSRRPSTAKVAPEEDQLTIFLGWLCDHSDIIARAVAEAFLAGDSEGLASLRQAKQVGAKVQVRLPALPTTGPLWADLSITADDRACQLLVEAKLDSGFHTYTTEPKRLLRPSAPLMQPEAYLHAWRSAQGDEAKVRRLGTLRLHGLAPPHSDLWRARDLTWGDIHRVILDLLNDAETSLSPGVALVAREFVGHLEARVLEPEVSLETLTRGKALVDALAAEIPKQFQGATASPSRLNRSSNYAGVVIRLPHDRHDLRFWLGVTPRATAYNVPGWDDVLQMQYYSPVDDPTVRGVLLNLGFNDLRDRKYDVLRAKIDLADLIMSDDLRVTAGMDWITSTLAEVLSLDCRRAVCSLIPL